MDLNVNGKKALILGGSRGIGNYTAQLLASEGCTVALCARDAEGVAQAVATLKNVSNNDAHFGASADLADADSTSGFVQSAIAALGGVDMLIHSASGFGDGSEEGWERSFQVDMMAGVRAVEAALPALKDSDAASITFIGSMASKFYFGRGRSSYGPAKAAMRAYANELAQEFGRDGIRANVISPGAVYFPGGSWDKTKQAAPDFYAKVEKRIPLGRLGTGEELARIIAFVASPAGLWINAAHIVGDGGQVAAVD